MSERLREALERLEEAIEALGYPLRDGLRPGLGEAEIRAQLAPLGIDPPADLITLFGWHNGYQTPVGQPSRGLLGPNLRTISLDRACREYVDMKISFEEMVKAGSSIGLSWFPVLDFTGWDSIIMNCEEGSPRRGAVTEWSPADDLPSDLPNTLAEPVERWAGLIESGQWTVDSRRRRSLD